MAKEQKEAKVMLTHAPYAIVNDLVIAIPGAKTMKTACGKRRPIEYLSPRGQQMCTECTKVINQDHADYQSMVDAAHRLGLV